MEEMRKMRILIISLICVFVVIALAFIGFKVFKGSSGSSQELFIKYAKQAKLKEFLEFDEQKDYIEKLSSEKQVTNGKISVEFGDNVSEEYNIVFKNDPENKKQSTDLKIKQNREEKLKATLLKNDDLYGLKCIYNQYLVAKDDDSLDDLLDKLEISKDSGDSTKSLKELDNILTNIDKYTKIAEDFIPKGNYSKLKKGKIDVGGEEISAEGNMVKINSEELTTLLEKYIETAKSDGNTNFADILNTFKKKIENVETKFTITVYAKDNQLVKVYAKFDTSREGEESYIDFTFQNNIIVINYVLKDNMQENAIDDGLRIEIEKQTSGDQNKYTVKLLQNDGNSDVEALSFEVIISGLDSENIEYSGTAKATLFENEIKLEFAFSTSFGEDVDIKNIEEEKHVILNDLSKEQIESLIDNLSLKINERIDLENSVIFSFMSMMQNIDVNTTSNNSYIDNGNDLNESLNDVFDNAAQNASSQAVEMFNMQFEAYEGNQIGASIKSLISKIKASNSSSSNKVEYDEGIEIEPSKSYSVSFEKDNNGYINKVNIEAN